MVADAISHTLADVLAALGEAGIRVLVVGEVASSVLARGRGGWRPTEIDLFLLPDDAERAADLLATVGFRRALGRQGWVHRVERDGVPVDLAYRQPGDVYVDEEMLSRAVPGSFGEVAIPLVPAEDLVVLKALQHGEDRPAEWWDALAILERDGLDWGYLADRARQYGGQRLLGLLSYARSLGLAVPDAPLETLFGFLEERREE